MRRRAEEDQLRRAQPQDLATDRVGAFERPLDHRAQHGVDLAQPPQGGGEQQAHEGPIARVELGKARMTGQGVVERLALVEAGDQHVERNAWAGIFHFVAAYKPGMFGPQTNWEERSS